MAASPGCETWQVALCRFADSALQHALDEEATSTCPVKWPVCGGTLHAQPTGTQTLRQRVLYECSFQG